MKKKPAKKAPKKRVNTKNSFPLTTESVNLLTSESDPKDQTPNFEKFLQGNSLNQIDQEAYKDQPQTLLPKGQTNPQPPTKQSIIAKRNASLKEKKVREEAEKKAKGALQHIAARKKAFMNAMVKSLGVVSKAVIISGIPQRTHFWWMEHDEVYREQINAIKEVALDFYEDALHDLIRQRQPAAIIFALKTQGRKRGYIETVHNVNQTLDDNNVVFYMPDNKRDEDIQEAKIVQ
jgi:hypothetical protein